MAMTNSTILDQIRLKATNDYQQRVPAASQAGIERVMKTLMNPMNDIYFNEFVKGLVNLIGTQLVRSKEWVNPLAKFKRVNINNKQTIQEIGFELIKAKGFDVKDNNLFEVNDPRVKVAYHTMNRQDRYDISINMEMLTNAFLTPTGLNDFISAALQVPINSDNYDEYNIMKQLISKYNAEYGFYNVQVPAINDSTTTDDMKKFIEKVRSTTGQMKFLKSDYNYYGVPTFTLPENSLLITTPEVVAKVDVNVLAAAFNVSFSEMQNKIIVIDSMPIENCYAILVDEDWFVCGDNLYRTSSFVNEMNLTTNYYLHHWSTLSVSPFMNAIMFTSAADTNIPEVTFTPNSYDAELVDENGNALSNISLSKPTYIVGTLSGTVTPENRKVLKDLTASTFIIDKIVDDSAQPIAINTRSYIDRLGRINLQAAVKANYQVTITATTTYNSDGVGENTHETVTKTFTVEE